MNLRRPEAVTHLYRGSPIVRAWSKYQQTDPHWTLCGIRRVPNGRTGKLAVASEDPASVNCPYCLELMRPSLGTGKARHPSEVVAWQDDGKVPW